MARELLNVQGEAPSSTGALINHTHFQCSNRIALPSTSRVRYWMVEFEKKLGKNESYLMVQGLLPGRGLFNYPNIGIYCNLRKSSHSSNGTSYGMSSENDWGYGGINFCGSEGNGDREGLLMVIEKLFVSSDATATTSLPKLVTPSLMEAGNKKLEIGHVASSGVRPCTHLNVNNNDDPRQHQSGSRLSILEFAF